jgi:hypothetical protein
MTAPLTVAEIDRQLAGLRDMLDRLGSDLYDIDNNNPTRTILATAPLSGATATRWADANDRITLVWALYGTAREALDGAVELRGTRSSLTQPQQVELTRLLTAASVELPPDAVALAQRLQPGPRSLISPAPMTVILDSISWSLAHVTSLVGEVTASWDRVLPRLGELERSLAEIESSARQAGVRVPNEVAVGQRSLADRCEQARTDPLSFDAPALDELANAVQRAEASVADLAAGRSRFAESRVDVVARLDQIDALVASIRQAQAGAAEKVLSPPGLAASGPDLDGAASEVAALRAEVTGLEAPAAGDGDVPVRQLALIDQRSAALIARLRADHASTTAALADRDELRGRLDAYRAKANAVGRSEDIELDDLHQQAMAELYQAPCDLDAARRLVEAYQRALNSSRQTEDR